jgi:ABC-type transport system involved in cytochrome bd biosynthesis fused ATPase/permease subunit
MRTGNILGFSATRYSYPKGPVHCACRWKWIQEHYLGIVLLGRFHDVSEGDILIDVQNIKELDIKTYRSRLALVSQEPILYQGSIGDNILFGLEREDKADEEIQRACAEANIWDFKRSLP